MEGNIYGKSFLVPNKEGRAVNQFIVNTEAIKRIILDYFGSTFLNYDDYDVKVEGEVILVTDVKSDGGIVMSNEFVQEEQKEIDRWKSLLNKKFD